MKIGKKLCLVAVVMVSTLVISACGSNDNIMDDIEISVNNGEKTTTSVKETSKEKETTTKKAKATEGLEYIINPDRKSYSVLGIGTATPGDIFIAEEYEGLPVTAIADGAFKDCEKLTGVTVPNSITSIGNEAFYGCTWLSLVDMPDSITYIGTSAFELCLSLTSIDKPIYV